MSVEAKTKHKGPSPMTIPHTPSLLKTLFGLLDSQRPAFGQDRVYWRGVALLLAEVLACGSHRVTDLLRTLSCHHQEWSAWYRLFEQPGRFEEEVAASHLLVESLRHVPASEWYVTGIDSTQVPRDSQQMEGSSWLRCPRNPAFRISIHRGQRFLNGSWLTPLVRGFSRAIPLRWLPAFPEKAVTKAHAPIKEQVVGIGFLQWVRQQLDGNGRQQQRLLGLGDGSFDKPEVWQGLPANSFVCVRTAKNRALRHLPGEYAGRGRRRLYGEVAPAPQAYLSGRTGWQTRQVTVRGRQRRMVYRVEGPFLRQGVPGVPLMLICVRGQEWRRGGKRRRRAACFYLINAVQVEGVWQLPLAIEVLLAWLWQRWELEVTHRESKSLLGLGDKQCWNRRAAVSSVQWSAWVYGLLMLTGYRVYGLPTPPPSPAAWYRHPKRWTLTSVVQACRTELWEQPDFLPLFAPSADNWQKIEAFLQRRPWSSPAPP
jgi:hypothetical protein